MLIIYDPINGIPVSDGKCEDEVLRDFNSSQEFNEFVVISSENYISAARALIAEGKIDSEKVVFEFEGKQFKPNKYGALQNWPNGFCDYGMIFAERVLRGAFSKKKQETVDR